MRSTRSAAAVCLGQGGKVAEAGDLLDSLWKAALRRSDALAECVVAHHLADLQDDPREELQWDLLSLAAAGRVTDEQVLRAEHLRGAASG